MDVPGYTRKDLDCSLCITEEARKNRGCIEELSKSPWPPIKLDDGRVLPITRCPLATVTRLHRRVVQLQSMTEAWHCLPTAGGILDQSNSLIQAMGIVSAVKYEMEENKRAK